MRIEQAAQEPEAQAQTGSTTQAATQRQGMTEQERQRAQQRPIIEKADAVSANQANVQTRPIAIRDLDDMEVYNARGERLGEVGRVVLDPRK